MSTVVEISTAIEKLDVKEQVELLRILPQHLKISLDDLAGPGWQNRPSNSGIIGRCDL